jgi:hypothetical protein
MDDLNDSIRHITSAAGVADAAFRAAVAPSAAATINLSMTFPIGTSVLDLVTGLKGVVVNGKRENVIVPTASSTGS